MGFALSCLSNEGHTLEQDLIGIFLRSRTWSVFIANAPECSPNGGLLGGSTARLSTEDEYAAAGQTIQGLARP